MLLPGGFQKFAGIPIGISRIFESLMVQQISANRRKNRSIQVKAKSTAAAAWIEVVSKRGALPSSSLISKGISVHPRMIPPAPCSVRRSMISQYFLLETSFITPIESSSMRIL